MKIRNNKKGFTVIELLAIVVVIAIISLIAMASVFSILKKVREKQYKTNLDAMGSAVKLFSNDAKNGLSKVSNALVYKDDNGKTWKIGCKKDETTNKRTCCVNMKLLRDIGYLKVTSEDYCADNQKCDDYNATITYIGNSVDVELLYGAENCEVVKFEVIYHSVVKFDAGSEAVVTDQCEYNKECVLLATPADFKAKYPGHTVTKWEDRRGDTYDTGKGKDFTTIIVSDKLDLFANWKNNEFTYKYNGDEKTIGTMSPSHHVYKDGSTLSPLALRKKGYSFDKWKDTNNGTEYYDQQPVSENTFDDGTVINLLAQWTANQYGVRFNANGGKNLSFSSMTVTYDQPYGDLPTVERDGYTFTGWYKSDGTQIKSSTIVQTDEDHMLYAHWKANKYPVEFNANGGKTPNPTTRDVTYDSAYGDLATVEREGYDFKGWWTAASGGTEITSSTIVKILAKQILYAHWKAKNYTVTFDKNGSDHDPSIKTKTVTYDSAYGDLPTIERTGYDFKNWWSAASGGTQVTTTTTVKTAKNHSVYAHWDPKKYTVSYNTNSCGTTTGTTKTVIYDAKYGDLAAFTAKTGYEFDGWYTAASGGSKITASSTVKTATDHTLYAHCSPRKFKVTFDKNGGDKVSKANMQVTYDANYGTLATSSRVGYNFLGWFTAKDGGTEIKSTTKVQITADQTLYAHWKYRCTGDYKFDASDNKCHYTHDATAYCPKGTTDTGKKCKKKSTYTAHSYYNGTCEWDDDYGHYDSGKRYPGDLVSSLGECSADNVGQQKKKKECTNYAWYCPKTGAYRCKSYGANCTSEYQVAEWSIFTCTCSGDYVYYCDGDDSLSGSTCTKYTYEKYSYKCPSGEKLSGKKCDKTVNPS